MKKQYLLLPALFGASVAVAQFAPQAGSPGTKAIHKDSSVFVNWATGATLERGWQDVADTTLGRVQVGDETYIPGKAGNGVVSLGDGGMAVVTFEKPVTNGNGYDFAVFENGFIDESLKPGNAFLELAFVEVSSDGVNFVRFPSECLNDTASQMASFEAMNAEKIHNLAGKYIANYGTPFDLEELKDAPGLDVSRITHIRIIDVTGSINPLYASRDSRGRIINDPYPTAFASGGFDLDAVGVIHEENSTGLEEPVAGSIRMFPNPVNSGSFITLGLAVGTEQIACYDSNGRQVSFESRGENGRINAISLPQKGIYLVRIMSGGVQVLKRVVVN